MAQNGNMTTRPSNTGQNVRVGIIDSGFMGFAAQMGTDLPASVHYRADDLLIIAVVRVDAV